MTPAARIGAAIDILDRIAAGEAAERALTNWARGARYAGSGDRAAVRDHVFDVLRRWRSCAALGGGQDGRALMLGLLRDEGIAPASLFTGQGHAPAPLTAEELSAGHPPEGAAALDLPDWLWPLWQQSLGGQAAECAQALRHRAPVMLRVNTGKGSRDAAQAALADEGILTQAAAISPTALVVTDGARRVAQSATFGAGLVELQDGASQALVDALPVPSRGPILDYCAGGGGKSLAMAARFGLPVLAHDAAPQRMKDVPQRAARAGARITMVDGASLAGTAPFELVLADVPCSGSGAWRRAPEGKWALDAARLDGLNALQGEILSNCAGLVARGGHLAYATCSVLRCENRDRIDGFLDSVTGWRLVEDRQWLPGAEGDGFYLAILAKPED